MLDTLRGIKHKMVRQLQGLRTTVSFLRDYRRYLRTGEKRDQSLKLLQDSFLFTSGRSHDFAARWVRRTHPPLPVADRPGLIAPLSPEEIRKAVAAINEDGIHIFPQRVPLEICDRLLDFAKTTPCAPLADSLGQQPQEPVLFDPARVIAPTYWFAAQDIASNPAAQLAFLDPSIWRVAQSYLGIEPIINLFAMWWSVPCGNRPDKGSAQLYHFDMDGVKWLKFFIYLTEVGPDNGPHVFLRGTHRRLPRALRRYSRIPDEEVYRHWPRERALEVVGPAGTLFAVDTRAFHKGKPVRSGHRLALELEFATDQYVDFPAIRIDEHFSPAFIDAMNEHPRLFLAFQKQERSEQLVCRA